MYAIATATVKVVRTEVGKRFDLPRYQTEQSAGMDLIAAIEGPVIIKPGERKLVPTGIMLELPPFLEAQVRPRSGLALKSGVTVLNSPGTIDADYRGEVGVVLINHHPDEPFIISPGDRIAQLVIAPIVQARLKEVAELSTTARGEGGYGSTGAATCEADRGSTVTA